ncbi:MAG: hypothetical protein V7739_08425 [Motiliproteus sp.]
MLTLRTLIASLLMLALMSSYGPGAMAEEAISEEDMAISYYLPLAESGEPYAQLTLGEIYYEGRGVKQNLVEAFAWLAVAIRQGAVEAQPLFDHVKKKLSPQQLKKAEALAGEYLNRYGS